MFSHKHKLILGLISFSILVVGVTAFLTLRSKNEDKQVRTFTSFDECVEAGNPVLESYPPQCRTEDGQSFTQDIGNELEMTEMIVIENPRPNQEISSPLTIKGRARGTYFFEATFPLRLVDENGNQIAEGYVEADGEWMTEDFVPFVGELEFETDATEGTLYLKQANPSDLPENDASLEVPVVFKKGSE